jgi:hypothetical protein
MIERELEYWAPGATEPVAIRVRIGLPEPAPGGDYQSTLSIEGFDRPHSAPFFQVDPLGAFLTAAAFAPSILFMLAKGGRLTWLEMADLHFPLLTPPKQYYTFRPADGGEPRSLSITINPPQEIDEQWACLMTFMKEGGDEEYWIKADTWAKALERAAASVPDRLQEYVDKAGGGTLEELKARRTA